MSLTLNQATIVGNITKDIEKKALPSGQSVATFSVATNRVWKDKDGQKQEDVEFHNIVVFGRTADTCAQYLTKGQNVLVIGRICTRSWNDKTTQEKKYRTEIVADTVQFGSKPIGAGGYGGSTAPAVQTSGYDGVIDYGDTSIDISDIPF